MKQKPMKMKHKFSPFYCILGILIALYSITIIISIYFMFMTAFKTPAEYKNNHWLFPGLAMGFDKGFTTINMFKIFTAYMDKSAGSIRVDLVHYLFMLVFNHDAGTFTIYEMLFNSIVYAVAGAFVSALVPCVMAYFASKFDYKFSKVIYATVVIVMIVPVVGTMPATVKMLKNTGLENTFLSMFALKANFVNMYFLVFFAAFKGVPKDYTEAAYIDGASEFRIMANVIMPLVKTTFLTIFLLFFVELWNDYQTPLLYIKDKPTISRFIMAISSDGMYLKVWNEFEQTFMDASKYPHFTLQMAACMTVAVPTLVVFCVFREKLMGNLSMGGIKG